jgi:hypothetical protein
METSGRSDDPVARPPGSGEPDPAGTSPPHPPPGDPVVAPAPQLTSPVPPPVTTASPSDGAGGLTSGDWPAQATDAIVDLVGTVRDKTTGPITTVARGVVLGLFAAVVGLTVAILALIGLVRLLDEALPSSVWLPYLILGVVFVAAGSLVYRKRKAPA